MPLFYKLALFVLVSAGLGWLTRNSLRSIRSHGFHRFFAFMAITALILMNLEHWFFDLLAPNQIAATVFLIISAYLVLHAARLLHKVGRPGATREDGELLGLEKTTELVTTGIYRYIRHPLYSSLLFLAWGAFFKRPSLLGAGLAFVATIFLTLTARMEEVENIQYFGDVYRDYMNYTRMFIPFLI